MGGVSVGHGPMADASCGLSPPPPPRCARARPPRPPPTQGLTDALIANSQQSKAVARLTKLRDELADAPTPRAATPAPSAAASTSAPDVAGEGTSAAAPAPPASGRAPRPVDPVAVQLLLGKAYAGWRGHDADALAAYDALIKSAPEDFRGYLAKGVFLKERGRRGDAERMFLQVRPGWRGWGVGGWPGLAGAARAACLE
jgi:hypothetical protein